MQKIGYRVRWGWSATDELCFEQGIRCLGRDFVTLRNSFLPGKDVSEVILYYYNIWKTQRSHSAKMWYAELREEKLESQRIEAACKEKEEEDRESEDERWVVLSEISVTHYRVQLARHRKKCEREFILSYLVAGAVNTLQSDWG